MKQAYSLLTVIVVCCTSPLVAQTLSQEKVGTPTSTIPVSIYSGWTYQGLVSYSGNTVVNSINASNNQYSSGGGNIFFTDTVGTYFQISGFQSGQPAAVEINFNMFGFDTANLNELVLSVSVDSGLTWSIKPYHRFLQLFYPPTPWDIMDASFDCYTNVNKLIIRFTQTTSIKTFRIDDISVSFFSLLPIKLQSFTVTVNNNNKAAIKWTASTTTDKDIFVIEKSSNGEAFSAFQKVAAKGNGSFGYEFNDVINSKTFYRLKMINVDGKSSYSNIVVVKSPSQVIQAVFPIPTKDLLHVRLNNQNEQKLTLSLTDATGHKLLKQTLTASAEMMIYDLNLKNFDAGIYYLTISTSDNHYSERIVVTK